MMRLYKESDAFRLGPWSFLIAMNVSSSILQRTRDVTAEVEVA